MDELIKKFNLPAYIKGKSFADASKAIQAKFKDREDVESMETQKELMGRLRQAQDYVKQMQEAPKAEDIADSTPSLEEAFQNQNFMGGILGQGEQGKTNAGMIGTAANGIGSGLRKDEDDTVIAGDPKDNQMIDGTKDAVASALGPYGQLARGAQKLGQGIGDQIGGNGGAVVSDIFSPEESTLAVMKDKDSNLGQKLLSTVPGVGGVVAKGLKDERISKEMRESTYADIAQVDNQYSKGGKMNSYAGGGKFPMLSPDLIKFFKNKEQQDFNDNAINRDAIDDAFANNPVVDNASVSGADDLKPAPIQGGKFPFGGTDPSSPYSDPQTGKVVGKSPEETATAKEEGSGTFLAQALRYAPVATNLGQLLSMKKPTHEGRDRINSRYKENLTDEEGIQNLVREQTSANREALVNASGGSGSTARANLLANHLQGTKALSDSYFSAVQANQGENRNAQQFNLGVAQTNLGQSNLEADVNAKNKGNYDTQKSKLIAKLGDDIGSIGREELLKKYPELMGSDYNWLGQYIKSKQSASA